MKVCVVVPCYKVKKKILKVYENLLKVKIDKILFIDDNCPEKSVKYLESRIIKTNKIELIYLKKNLGVGGATLKGFKIANKQKQDIVIKFDGDNQHYIKDLKKIINIMNKNKTDFCKGFRNLEILNFRKTKMPILRILGTILLTFMSRIVSGNYELKDVTNGLIGIKIKKLKKIKLNDIKKNFFFEQDLIFNLCLNNINIHQVPTKVLYSNENSNLNEFKIIVPFLYYHLRNLIKRVYIKFIKI